MLWSVLENMGLRGISTPLSASHMRCTEGCLCLWPMPLPHRSDASLHTQMKLLSCFTGFVVMRCLFNTAAKDVRRFRLYEKSLDALATSPYAKTVDRWLLAGASHQPFMTLHLHVAFKWLHAQTGWEPVLVVRASQKGVQLRWRRLGKWCTGGGSRGWPMPWPRCRLLPAVLPPVGEPALSSAWPHHCQAALHVLLLQMSMSYPKLLPAAYLITGQKTV